MDASQAETLTNIGYTVGYILLGIIGARAAYRMTPKRSTDHNPMLQGIGLGWVDRDQMERLIDGLEVMGVQITRIADQVISSADMSKQAADARIAKLLEHIEEQDRKASARRRRPAKKKKPEP
jgi:hypothetical protein